MTEADPTNAEAYYHVGQCYMQLQQFEEALPWFKRAIEIDPYLRSAYYRAFQAAQRLRDRERADAFLERFQGLEANPRSHLVEFKYTRMGKLGEVVALGTIVVAAGEDLVLTPLRERVARAVWSHQAPYMRIEPAQLGARGAAWAGLMVAFEAGG